MSLKTVFGITACVATAATVFSAAESTLELQRFPKYKTYSHAFRHRFGLHTVESYATGDGLKPTYKLCSSSHHGSISMYWVPITERCVDCDRCYRDKNLSTTKHLVFNRKKREEPTTWLDGADVLVNTNSQHWIDAFPGESFLSRMNLARQRVTPSCPKTEKDRLHPTLLKTINRHYSNVFSKYKFYISDLPNHVWIWYNNEITSEHLEALKYVVDLDLTGCRGITDVSALATGNVEKLDLGFCRGITDVSALENGSVYTLSLAGCQKVTDVSSLGNMLKLNLSYCDGVKDVSSLGNMLKLNLSYCKGVTDVSSLGGVHILNLSHCKGVTDVSSLGGVHTLNLSGCTGVTDVSSLGKVHTLDLTGCDKLQVDSVYHLSNVKELKLPKHIC
jgi:hypothetical protein